jgi:UDP-N-acetyl-D-glucosamine/UDP-N-acetyl-D-galactosamine dehydrogenase
MGAYFSPGVTIGVVGLGYVGLPLAVALANHHHVVAFDVNERRVRQLQQGIDSTRQIGSPGIREIATLSTDESSLSICDVIIVTVPTPIDDAKNPDLRFVVAACETIARVMKPGAIIVFESTVYPGATEEVCIPVLEKRSNMFCGTDFFVGYSPERINPGDETHTLSTVIKIVAGQNQAVLDKLIEVYGPICEAGLHLAPSIRVAEAAKVIENAQRDLNIAFMNELAQIFDRLGISTAEVLAAAGTKWNFLPFVPGLVGGHCIGVDPYYLTHKANQVGYHPDVILAGRRVNDSMGSFVASKCIKLMIQAGRSPVGARVAVLGLTFKENVPDLRNSRVPELVLELKSFGVEVLVHDPVVSCDGAEDEYGIQLSSWGDLTNLDGVVYAVPHNWYRGRICDLVDSLAPGTVLADVKRAFSEHRKHTDLNYWSL